MANHVLLKSKYNVIHYDKECIYIFNTLTKALLEISKSILDEILNNEEFAFKKDNKIIKMLYDNGVLINSNRDEFKEIMEVIKNRVLFCCSDADSADTEKA